MKKVLIVGGAGFIGSQLQKQLKLNGSEVTVIDSFLQRVHGEVPINLPENVFNIDSRNPEEINHYLNNERFYEIYFLASDTSTGSSLEEIDSHVSQNASALAGLLRYLNITRAMPDRIVLTSSRAIYGEGHQIGGDNLIELIKPRYLSQLKNRQWNKNINVGSKFLANCVFNTPNPNNVYGVTKLFQENLLRVWAIANAVKFDVYRLQNVIGPGQSPNNPYSGVITNFCKDATLGKKLKVFEDGTIVRDFVHVEDVAAVLQIPLKEGFTHIDIGNYKPIRLLDVARKISEYCSAPEPEVVSEFRIGDVHTAYACACSIKALSRNWVPRIIDLEVLGDIVKYVKEFNVDTQKP
jgi:dTDP-L-rhamnose 4-epimerase